MIDFNSLIDQHLHRELREKRVGRYWPSSVGMCLRKAWYSYKQPKETPVETLRIFEAGNLVHDFVAEVLRSEKTPGIELLKSELPFELEEDGFVISGRVDDVILVKAEGKTYLVEVKSTKSLAYQKKPTDSHAMQLQLYMHATGITNGVVLYVEKNTLQAKEFDVPYDEAAAQAAIDRFRALHKALTEDELPAPEAKRVKAMKWMCGYCDWAEECGATGTPPTIDENLVRL
jgi:CRISPR/Cas system-associated exonuclease Cas4 (RecB family)